MELDYIVPELRGMAQPVGTFGPHPDNARDHNLEALAYSLEKHGQRSPVIVQRSTGFIVKGNGTHAAAQMLGWTHLAFIEQDLDDKEALHYLWADNKASDHARWNRKKLRAGLQKMVDGPGLFDGEWAVEELADLTDEEEGPETVDAEANAEFAPNTFAAKAQKAEPRLPGEKMREVPLVLTIADHAAFVERIKALQKRYGTGGTIATIIEAVKRQYDAENGAEPFVGKPPVVPPLAEGQLGIDDAFNHADELLDAALGGAK